MLAVPNAAIERQCVLRSGACMLLTVVVCRDLADDVSNAVAHSRSVHVRPFDGGALHRAT